MAAVTPLIALFGVLATAAVFFFVGRLVGSASEAAAGREQLLTVRTALAEATTALTKEVEKH